MFCRQLPPSLITSVSLILMSALSFPVGAATFTVTSLNDSGPGSLRQAVFDSNAALGADTITFQTGLTGTITLTSGEIPITDTLAINGPGASVLAVSGNRASRIFSNNAYFIIQGLTLKEGYGGTNGGCIYNAGTLFIVRSKVKTTGFSRSDLSLKPFAKVGKRDGVSIR